MAEKCSFGEGVVIKPNGVDELDPCKYEVIEEYTNVTVRVMKCKVCGHEELEWERQPNTIEVVELDTFPDYDEHYSKVFAVPKDWLVEVLERMDSLNNREGVSLENFLQNYVWDETIVIYEQAVFDGKILREEEK